MLCPKTQKYYSRKPRFFKYDSHAFARNICGPLRCFKSTTIQNYEEVNSMDVRENWEQLNQRIKEENEVMRPSLIQIHMGAFEDLRKNGHMITANGQPVNILAETITPDERFSLACQVGRGLINSRTGNANGGLAVICDIQKADFFPNCIAVALGAILENIYPGLPGMKMTVLCNYDTIQNSDDPLGKALSALEPCFPWAAFQLKATKKEPPQPAVSPALPLDQMSTLFRADGLAIIDTARTSFSGSVVRGEIREGDVLNVTDGGGHQICPPGVVKAIFLKDRFENGKAACERSQVLIKDQHADSVLVAVEIPKGSYNGILLSKKDGGNTVKKSVGAAPETASDSPLSGEDRTVNASKSSFFSRLFGKRKI